MLLEARALSRALFEADLRVALLQRCLPTNRQRELERVTTAWQAGDPVAPRFEYAPTPNLASVRAELAGLAQLTSCGPWGELIAERAREIDTEAATVEALNTPLFRSAARRRYHHQNLIEEAHSLALAWVTAGVEAQAEWGAPQYRSDDSLEPRSLWRRVDALLRAEGVTFRVEASDNLIPLAATGAGVIFVAKGRMLSAQEGERVAVHEVLGHALPRSKAVSESNGLFLVGTAGASDDEEGRALILEERSNLLHAGRRFSLALRHLAAQAMFEGASYVDAVRSLLSFGCHTDVAVAIAARVFRGGGLGREIVYLPAMLRIRECFERRPALETWFLQGRVSTRWAERLQTLGRPPKALTLQRGYEALTSSAITGQ